MSEYGIKIKNYQAASIYECNLGIRRKLDETSAMLTNSLFKDFLIDNGLKLRKEDSTRDIVCVQFDYGTKDYSFYKSKFESFEDGEELLNNLENIKDDYTKISKQELRRIFYNEGFSITYRKYNQIKRTMVVDQTIHYKMLFRTPGKAKKGSCMFICDRLYNKARKFLYMGIRLPKKNAPIVEIGAYSSLITSSIVGTVQIKPEEILILKDVDSFFRRDAISVELNSEGHCVAKKSDDYQLKNTLFDGQALIDSSIFPDWGDGYVLLRHHFTKCAAFKAHIQKFMCEHYGADYHTAVVKDMWGRDVKVDKIKLITTDNAIKWLKFPNITFDYWAEWIRANNCQFGIVKTAHSSKLGNVQRMSYQMNNALDIETMDKTTAESVSYIDKLKNDDGEFLNYLSKNINFSNDFEVLLALIKHNPLFINSDYFKERRVKIIQAYTLGFKSGHSIQVGDNLVIVGNPYAMLLHAVGDDPLADPTFTQEDGAIQCWTARFDSGEYLAEFRNPFNSRNNLGCLHNVHHEYFDKYFDFGKLIVAVNMIGTAFQDRNNGLTNWASVQKCA